ncbi:hypothetical protein ACH4FA_02140 [Streptomyces sp. NPDC017966]|uniref:hypothetical protein n=1 Tax=unclassified Streptomyces TaxID=2593676 RepID=UPI001C1E4DB7|nr:hypothetical protein [Streptomyces sp. PAM3C]MBU5946466.1 hypothetical protein [Streptomyces sp. PAM3C]
MKATEWAEDQRRRAELDDLMAQVADREVQLEDDLIAAYDEYELDCSQDPKPEADLACQPARPHRPASRRRSRGR